MKCGLVQILAVTMILGHTVLANWYNSAISSYKLAPEPAVLDGVKVLERVETDVHTASKDRRLLTSKSEDVSERTGLLTVKNGDVELVNMLGIQVDNAIQELAIAKKQLAITKKQFDAAKEPFAIVKFSQFTYKNEEQAYSIVKKTLELKELVLKSIYEDRNMLLTKIDEALGAIVPNLRNAKENAIADMSENYVYLHQIKSKIRKIDTSSLNAEDMQSIRKTCNNAGIDCANIGTHLSTAQLEEKLEKVKDVLDGRIEYAQKILEKMHDLLLHIDIKKSMQITKHDTRDTQSMRNVIGISIAVCAIVTMYCITNSCAQQASSKCRGQTA